MLKEFLAELINESEKEQRVQMRSKQARRLFIGAAGYKAGNKRAAEQNEVEKDF